MSPRPQVPLLGPTQQALVLLISPNEDDHALLPQILNHPNWIWRHSRNGRHARAALKRNHNAVVFCDREQPDGDWRLLLEAACSLAHPPSVILYSRVADERFWVEVLNLGGFDVLLKPFELEEVMRVSSAAWRAAIRNPPGPE